MLKNIKTHTNLKKIGKNYYVFIPLIIRNFMEIDNEEPICVKYNNQTHEIIIKKEKSVAGL